MVHTLRTPVAANQLETRFHDATQDAILVELLNPKPNFSASNLGLAAASFNSLMSDKKSVNFISGTNPDSVGFASEEKINFNRNMTLSSANTVNAENAQPIGQNGTLLNHVALGTSGTAKVPFSLEGKTTNKNPIAGMHAGPPAPPAVV